MVIQGWGDGQILTPQFLECFAARRAFSRFFKHLTGKSSWAAPSRQALDYDNPLHPPLRHPNFKAELDDFAGARTLTVHIDLATADGFGC